MTPAVKEEDSRLIAKLTELSQKSPKLVKSTVYKVATDATQCVDVRSWKMNEFKYYDVPSPFPTLARGIFTTETNTKHKYRMVARGYDKFFNMGEVPWTTWNALAVHTSAPYTLSLKSNGCIIFIAALTPSKLLVTSKHAIGDGRDGRDSHAQVGERWLRKAFACLGKSEEELAKTLWDNNWTAIAELCDDSFEEHVLAYPPELTGLHLHGLNVTTKRFVTLPHKQVDKFAEEWGFIKTQSQTFDNITDVKAFTDEIGKTGFWRGEAIEGFVVRTHIVASDDRKGAPPYPPGSTFFWKVKYDEPYMMYRDWRECTKKLLTTSEKTGVKLVESVVPKSKLKRAETRLYVRWCIGEIGLDKSQFKEYMLNRGIVAAREKFLTWLNSPSGQARLALERKAGTTGPNHDGGSPTSAGSTFVLSPIPPLKKVWPKGTKTIIVPIAIPGCGKTSVAVALSHIFGFQHTQSDDVHAKRPAPVFIKNVVTLLEKNDVVIADKNNHLRFHRTSLRDATARFKRPVRLIALNWSLDMPAATVHRICGDRVSARGQNHQTLRADTKEKTHEDIVWQFITSSEELSDNEVDVSIDMVLGDTLEQMVERAVSACVDHIGVPCPSQAKIDEGVAAARGYAPKKKKADSATKKLVASYYSLLPEVEIVDLVEKSLPLEKPELWNTLNKGKRVVGRPHITIVHKNSLPQETELWERCAALHRMESPPAFTITAKSIVWDDKIMAIAVDDFSLDFGSSDDAQSQAGHEFISQLAEDIRLRMHITVGTIVGVPAVDAQTLVRSWRKDPKQAGLNSVAIPGGLVLKGRVKGIFLP